MKKILLSTLFLFCINLQAQQSTMTSGGNASGSGGTVSYSVGQVSYKSPEGNLISDGVQQPYEIMTLGKDDFPELKLLAYPNPVIDELHLLNTDPKITQLSYTFTDISGKILTELQELSSKDEIISMQNYSAGVYLLQVYTQNKKLKTFKIIKK